MRAPSHRRLRRDETSELRPRRLLVATLTFIAAVTCGSAPDAHATPPDTTIEPNGIDICEERAAEPFAGTPWQQDRIDVSDTWEHTTGLGVLVAIIDTGVDSTVPQLAGQVLPGTDVVNGDSNADRDCDGHGTFVAGIVAATRNDTTGFVGVAPGAVILPVRQANSTEDGTAGTMAAAVREAVDADAMVINISASATQSAPVLADAILYAEENDVVVIASVSNIAEGSDPVSYPAAYPTVLAVGSMSESGERSDFSGTATDVDLVAPGEEVVSVVAGTEGHAAVSGTSFATPFVSGVAALVRSRHPELTAEQVRYRLTITADHPGVDRPDDEVGWGVVNPHRAVTAELPEETDPLTRRDPDTISLPDQPSAADTLASSAARNLVTALASGTAGLLLFLAVVRGYRRSSERSGPSVHLSRVEASQS